MNGTLLVDRHADQSIVERESVGTNGVAYSAAHSAERAPRPAVLRAAGDAVAGDVVDPSKRRHPNDPIGVGVGARRLGELDPIDTVQELKRDAVHSPGRCAPSRRLSCCRTRSNGDVGERRGQGQMRDPAASARRRISNQHGGTPGRGADRARPFAIVAQVREKRVVA